MINAAPARVKEETLPVSGTSAPQLGCATEGETSGRGFADSVGSRWNKGAGQGRNSGGGQHPLHIWREME